MTFDPKGRIQEGGRGSVCMASAPRPWSDYGISSTLEVRESEQYGRGVYAVTAIPPGVEVMEAKPLVHVLSNDVRGQHCDFCLKVSQ